MILQWWFDHAPRRARPEGGAIAGAPNLWALTVTPEEWRQAAQDIAAGGGRLLSLWASRSVGGENVVRAAFTAETGALVLALPVAAGSGYPGIEQSFPNASRLQRAVADL